MLIKLDDTVNRYSNAYHTTIKMKPVDVNPSVYMHFNKESNKEIPKFKVEDNVRISKYQNLKTWQKVMFQIGMKKFL